jgi:hypothetical protein
MKLTPGQIDKLERFLTLHEDGLGHRGLMIEFDLQSLVNVSAALTFFRSMGIDVIKGPSRKRGFVNAAELQAFQDWLRDKRREAAE